MAFLLSILPEPNAPVQICMDGRTWQVRHQGLTAALRLRRDRKFRPTGRFLVSPVVLATSVMGHPLPAPSATERVRNDAVKGPRRPARQRRGCAEDGPSASSA